MKKTAILICMMFMLVSLSIFPATIVSAGSAYQLSIIDTLAHGAYAYSDICCTSDGLHVFAVASNILSAFSFDGASFTHIADASLLIATNHPYKDVECKSDGSRVFISFEGGWNQPEEDEDGILAYDFNGVAFSHYSTCYRTPSSDPFDMYGFKNMDYYETDDVVFVSATNNGIYAFKNNGTAYVQVSQAEGGYPSTNTGRSVRYNEHDGYVYAVGTTDVVSYPMVVYSWNNATGTLAYAARCANPTGVSGWGCSDVICSENGAVTSYAGPRLRWFSLYDGDGVLDHDTYAAESGNSGGVCWVGDNQGPSDIVCYTRGGAIGIYDVIYGTPESTLTHRTGYSDGAAYGGLTYAMVNTDGVIFATVGTSGVRAFHFRMNYSPVVSNPNPSDGLVNVSCMLSNWSVTIEDLEGDVFDYSIECNNSANVSGSGVANGTFSLNFSSDLANDTTYYVWVNATDPLGSNTYTRENFSFTTGPCGGSVTADFTYSPNSPVVNEKVTFRDQSNVSAGDVIISWLWNFGDGSGVGKNVDHTFDKEGRFGVTLTVRTLGGLSDDITRYVQVSTISYDDPRIFPPIDPFYPSDPYTIPDMYRVLRANDASLHSDNQITIVFIDTGYTPRTYAGVDLSKIIGYSYSYSSVFDSNGHGTWISYALGYIVQVQIPNARLISYNIFGKDGVCSMDNLLDAFDYVEKLKPDIISFSGGAYGSPNDAISRRVDRLRSNGILVVVAAGNLGPSPSTILSPACSEGAIAVGAIDPKKTILERSDDIVRPWSSRGPVSKFFIKPDCTSPGESIVGPWLEGERIISGTSMATPLIAGGYAVIYAHNKGLLDIVETLYFWDRGTVGNILESGVADTIFKRVPVDSYGLGIPDFKEADHAVFISAILHILLIVVIIVVIAVIIIYAVYRWKFSEEE